ncbi:hypothetical protein F2Q69_00043897 [Brassica cretica]|uniref:FAD-binding PCMH-type domain-containing protein n=1 Tax=Brassica cretica TaxID=69181 RepID=A0A8S9NA32_BRACR|nr:hypothetical protein F2Q69_00043897 [Brassica cretica]
MITILVIITTLLTPITTNTSSLPWNILSKDNFARKLTTASSSVESAATDFGHITKIFPSAVLNPSSVQDITDLIKLSFDSQSSFPLAARGHGHSHRGQAAAKDGVVVNMRSMVNRDRGIKVSRTGLYADVDSAWLWIEVLNKTLELGLTPVSWTDYLHLTVGGTLSNGGISGQTFRYGPQISNVLEMDVITARYGILVGCKRTFTFTKVPIQGLLERAMDSGIASLSGAVAWASDSESLFVEPSGWTSRTGFRARPRFTFGSKAVRRLIGSRFACGRFPPGSFKFKVRDLAPAYMTCMERTEYSPETVWSADQNFEFLVYRAMFPSKDCLKGMRVWRPLPWVFLRAMDSGIASLSGAVAWASDSESLFVEPSGVL